MTTAHKVVGSLIRHKQFISIVDDEVSIIELPEPQGRRGYTHSLRDSAGAAIGWLSPIPSKPGYYLISLYHPAVLEGVKGLTLKLSDFLTKEEPKPEYHRPRTIEDMVIFLRLQNIRTEDYFSTSIRVRPTEGIYTEKTRWVAVYWVEGGSEGYYLHVDRLIYDQALDKLVAYNIATGKYWQKEDAGKAVELLTPFVHGLI